MQSFNQKIPAARSISQARKNVVSSAVVLISEAQKAEYYKHEKSHHWHYTGKNSLPGFLVWLQKSEKRVFQQSEYLFLKGQGLLVLKLLMIWHFKSSDFWLLLPISPLACVLACPLRTVTSLTLGLNLEWLMHIKKIIWMFYLVLHITQTHLA